MTKKRSFEMGKFDGILICTDLDGTLLRNDKSISDENINAIEYFKKEGGIFTFVTGRMPFFVSDMCEMVKPNGPFGCINGGGLYDYNKKEYMWMADMSDNVLELVRLIDKKFPEVGFQVNTYSKTYFCKDNNITEATDFGLKIDGLDESIEYGKWTPGSDSCMSLSKMEFIDGKRNYYKILESL